MMILRRWRWRRAELARAAWFRQVTGSDPGAGLPDPGVAVRQAPMLAIDLEMTGLDPARDAIISIGWVPVSGGTIELGDRGAKHLDAAGQPPVGSSATIHGIRDCDRHGGVEPGAALADLAACLDGRIALFHHAPLDVAFLDRALRAAFATGWCWPWIDTLNWFRRRQHGRDHDNPASPTHLDAVRLTLGLPSRDAHDALADAISCAEVALALAARSRARVADVVRVPR